MTPPRDSRDVAALPFEPGWYWFRPHGRFDVHGWVKVHLHVSRYYGRLVDVTGKPVGYHVGFWGPRVEPQPEIDHTQKEMP